MSLKTTLVAVIFILMLTISISLIAAPLLPERVASHWDANGTVNGYQGKSVFLWTMPIIMLVTVTLLIVLPMLDPLKTNFVYVQNIYYLFIIGMMLFLLYIHIMTLVYNMGYRFNMTLWMMPAMGLLFFFSGFLIEQAHPNWFIGIRTPWTLSNPVVWQKTHKLGGLAFKVVGLITLVGVFFPQSAFLLMMVPLMVVTVFLLVYSYVIFQQEQNKKQP